MTDEQNTVSNAAFVAVRRRYTEHYNVHCCFIIQGGPKNRTVFWKFETPVYVDVE